MDNNARWKNARTAGLIVALLLLITVPASAAGDPVSTIEMPMPVPDLPSVVPALSVSDLPAISRGSLPQVSGLPSRISAINAVANTSDAVLSRSESLLADSLSSANSRMNRSRSLVSDLRARVGAPTSEALIKARDDTDAMISYTAYEAAEEMRDSVFTTTAYLRGLSGLGGVGLNLTFIILGLGWIAVVNLIDVGMRIGIFMMRVIAKVVTFIFALINFLINLFNAIANWLDIVTGPIT